MAGDIVGKMETLTFHMQIGLVRESVTVQMESGNLTLTTLKDIACAFVDRKVQISFRWQIVEIFTLCIFGRQMTSL